MNKKIKFIISAFLCVASVSIGRVFYLQTVKQSFLSEKVERQRANPVPIDATRGDIKTADGATLATSVPSYNVYSDTRYIKDIEQAAKVVSDFFELDYKETLEKINTRYYMELVKEVPKTKIDEFLKVAPKGIGSYESTTRVYPNNSLLGKVLGFTGSEGKGLSGLELKLDEYLRGVDGVDNSERDKHGNTISYNQEDIISPIDGSNTTLTINYDIQYQMEKIIKNAVEEFEAKAGLAITMNPKDGSILGIAEYPTLNPNNYKEYDTSFYKSLSLSMTYEPGSTFKPITVAIADATNSVDIKNTSFPDNGSYYIGNKRIKNYGGKSYGSQTAREILMNSSNVGTVQIAMQIPSSKFGDYLKKFGFGTKTGIEIPGEQNSIMFSSSQLESKINKATNSFGQGIAVTPLQLMRAWSAIVNGGYLVNPHILDSVVNLDGTIAYSSESKTTNLEQIISKETSDTLKDMLKDVVEKGTGTKAKVPGYTIGGKTGTAQTVENGVYSTSKYKVSFLGFAPVENPEILTLVLIDSPNGNASGGSQAAPSAGLIMEYALNKLGIMPNIEKLENDTSENKEDEIQSVEAKVSNYTYRLKSYVLDNPPSIPYEFEGDGDIIIKQHYKSSKDSVKVVFVTDKVVKKDYIIMPNLTGMLPKDFMPIFSKLTDRIVVNGDFESKISVQEDKPGEKINITSEKVVLWSE